MRRLMVVFMRSTCFLLLAAVSLSSPAWAAPAKSDSTDAERPAARPAAAPAKDEKDATKEDARKVVKCDEHGVSKKLCTRCNPKLEPVFKAKGDWCEEHTRPESQCVLCHPELEKKGVK